MHGFIPEHRYYAYKTWPEIRDLPDKANVPLILPIGSIEQHGPHLPLAVDSALALGVVGEALKRLPLANPALCLPPLYYGKSNEHDGFSGTITLSATTLLTLLMEIGAQAYVSGFRKLVMINGHGGQPQILEIAARDLHVRHRDFHVWPLFLWNVPNNANALMSPREASVGIHAGDGETSLMMKLLPNTVHMDRAEASWPAQKREGQLSYFIGGLPKAWTTSDISENGTVGDPTTATLEKGEKILDDLASSWVKVFDEIHRWPVNSQHGK
jgi:creatinine amidohydrolase